jgi:hypothetical protein
MPRNLLQEIARKRTGDGGVTSKSAVGATSPSVAAAAEAAASSARKGKGGRKAGSGEPHSFLDEVFASKGRRALTEEEQERVVAELLKENEEFRGFSNAGVTALNVVVGLGCLYLLIAHMQTPFRAEAAHLAPLRGLVDTPVLLASLAVIIFCCALNAVAAWFGRRALAQSSAALSLLPLLLLGAAQGTQGLDWLLTQWALLWLPITAPGLAGMQLWLARLFDREGDEIRALMKLQYESKKTA